MKAIKYLLSAVLLFSVIWSCDDDFGSIDFVDSAVAPSDLSATFEPTQDNSGVVVITPNGVGVVSYSVDFGDGSSPETVQQGQSISHTFAEGTYDVKLVGTGITGLKGETTVPLVVSFRAPENLEVVMENSATVSKQVNVTANADFAMSFDVYFGEPGMDDPVSGNIGETVSYVYAEPGVYTVRVVAKGAAIATTEFTQEFEAIAIVQPIASAPDQPNRAEEDVISVFSSKYNDIPDTDYNPDWGQSGQGSGYGMFELNGDQMLNYTNLSYQGIQLGAIQDVTGMEMLHIDIWTADDMSIDIYPLQVGVPQEEEKFVTKQLVKDQWNSFDIPMTEFTDQGLAVDQIHQFKFVGNPWAGGTVFIDNIYFWKTATVYADLPITFDSSVETFEAFLDAEFAIVEDPTDATNQVGQITNYGQGWGWEGVKLALDTPIDVSATPTLQMDFHTDTEPHTVLLKLEDSSSPKDGNGNPTVFEEIWVDVNETGWSNLVFNFTSGLTFDTVVLFVDGGVYDITGVYYFDNLRAEEYVALPLTMDTPGQTFEAFLDAEFALAADPEDASNSVGMITNYGQGWGWEGVKLALNEWIDLSTNSTITMDFYTSDQPHKVLLKLEDSTSPKDGNGNPTVFKELEVDVTATGWSNLAFDFEAGGSFDTVVLFVNGGVYDITGTYYFDNITQQ